MKPSNKPASHPAGTRLDDVLQFGLSEIKAKGLNGGCLDAEIIVTTMDGISYTVNCHMCINEMKRVLQ